MPDYLDDLCIYKGTGSDLPVGGYSAIPKWGPEKLAKRWIVEDTKCDAGIIEKRTPELTAEDIIIGVELNQNLIKYLIESSPYGKNFYMIREANGTELMNMEEWKTKFGTDGLSLVAIRNIRQILSNKRQITDIGELTRRRQK